MLDKNWQSFFAATKEYKVNPGKFLGRPKLPQYKDKQDGRNLLVYTIQAISSKLLRIGQVKLSGLNVFIKTAKTVKSASSSTRPQTKVLEREQ